MPDKFENERDTMNKHKAGPLDIKPDNQTIQQCCICYGGSSFPDPMREALEHHLSILRDRYPVLVTAPELLEVCKTAETHYAMLCEAICFDNPLPGGMSILTQLRAAIAAAEGKDRT